MPRTKITVATSTADKENNARVTTASTKDLQSRRTSLAPVNVNRPKTRVIVEPTGKRRAVETVPSSAEEEDDEDEEEDEDGEEGEDGDEEDDSEGDGEESGEDAEETGKDGKESGEDGEESAESCDEENEETSRAATSRASDDSEDQSSALDGEEPSEDEASRRKSNISRSREQRKRATPSPSSDTSSVFDLSTRKSNQTKDNTRLTVSTASSTHEKTPSPGWGVTQPSATQRKTPQGTRKNRVSSTKERTPDLDTDSTLPSSARRRVSFVAKPKVRSAASGKKQTSAKQVDSTSTDSRTSGQSTAVDGSSATVNAPVNAPDFAVSSTQAVSSSTVAASVGASDSSRTVQKKRVKSSGSVGSGSAAAGKVREKKRKRHESTYFFSYKSYMAKLLPHSHPDLTIGKAAMEVMNDMMHDVFDKLMREVEVLKKKEGVRSATLNDRDIKAAVQFTFTGELSEHAIKEADKALAKYNRSKKMERGRNED